MLEWLLSNEGFVPRKFCVTDDPSYQYPAMAAEILTGVAYLAIPAMLMVLYWNRPQLIPSKSAVIGFIAFILACGVGHLLDAVVWEYPAYNLWLVSRWVTGIVSFTVFLMLYPIYKQLRNFRSSSEYHAMANQAHEAMLKAEAVKAKAEKKSDMLEREFVHLEARIVHLEHIGVTASEVEALKLQLKRIRRVESAA